MFSCKSDSHDACLLAELLIYFAFMLIGAAALRSIWPITCLVALFVVTWLPRMWKKDELLSRYPKFAAWKQHTALFIPFVKSSKR